MCWKAVDECVRNATRVANVTEGACHTKHKIPSGKSLMADVYEQKDLVYRCCQKLVNSYASYFLRPALTPQHHITSFHLVAVQLISSYLILTHFISSYLIFSHVTSACLRFFHLISVDPILSHLSSYEHANGRASEHASNT